MASLISKTVKGKQYWYLVESKRIDGKVKQIVLEYIGNQKKLSEYVLKTRTRVQLDSTENLTIKSYQHGDVYALYKVASNLGIETILESAFDRRVRNGVKRSTSILLAAIHRASCPGSKSDFHKWMGRTTLPYHFNLCPESMTSQHFWSQMDGITEAQLRTAEDSLTKMLLSRYKIGLDKIALDYTNYFTYIDSTNDRNTLAKRGKNKQKRNDLRQCSLAIVTTKELNLPLFSHVYEGNTNDQTEFPEYLMQLKERIPNYNPQEITLVFDGGSNTKKNLELLETHYICSFSLSYCKELYGIDLSGYQTFNVKGKEVLAYRLVKSIWGKERECILTFSDSLYKGQVAELKRDIEKVQTAIEKLNEQWKNPKSRIKKTDEEFLERTKKILHGKYLSEFITIQKNEEITCEIDEEKEQKVMACYFGKKLIISDHKDWSTDLIIQSYREQDGIEKIFHDTKDTEHFSMRPIYHWTDQKIRVHIFLCLLGLTLTIILQKELIDRGINISKDTLMNELSGIRESWVKENRDDTIGGQVIRKLEEMNECQKKIWEIIAMI